MYIIIKGTLTGGRRCTGLRGRATRRWSGSCFTGTSPPPTSSSRPQTRSVCCRSADCLSLGGNNSTIESHPFPSILADILAANPDFSAANSMACQPWFAIFRPFVLPSSFQHRRSALHYAARCPDTDRRVKISETIRNAGADGDALDAVSERIQIGCWKQVASRSTILSNESRPYKRNDLTSDQIY